MKRILASLALATVVATGAHAQTFTGSAAGGPPLTGSFSSGSYTVNISPIVVTQSAGVYTYQYTATLAALSGPPSGFAINQISLNLPVGFFTPGLGTTVSGSGFDPLLTQGNVAGSGSLTFNAPMGSGLTTVGNSTVFQFTSTLPPRGTIGIVGRANGTDAINSGGRFVGPGAVVPEPGSFALLGLGLLPLAFVARRRIARSA